MSYFCDYCINIFYFATPKKGSKLVVDKEHIDDKLFKKK